MCKHVVILMIPGEHIPSRVGYGWPDVIRNFQLRKIDMDDWNGFRNLVQMDSEDTRLRYLPLSKISCIVL